MLGRPLFSDTIYIIVHHVRIEFSNVTWEVISAEQRVIFKKKTLSFGTVTFYFSINL